MNPILIALGVALGLSLLGNGYLFDQLGDAREASGKAEQARADAVSAAESCDAAVGDLLTKALQQAADSAEAIEQARKEGLAAGRRAQGERTRPPAVPGDACASAKIETQEWLHRRQSRP